MIVHGLMRPAFLVALLLFVSQASAFDPIRLLRGISEQTSVEVDQASMQDLGQGEPPYHQEDASADVVLRQLAVKRRSINGHRGHPAKASRHHHRASPSTTRQRMKGTHPSHHRASPGSRTFRHAPQGNKQRMKGSSHSSPRHGTPGSHNRMNVKPAGTRGNVADRFHWRDDDDGWGSSYVVTDDWSGWDDDEDWGNYVTNWYW